MFRIRFPPNFDCINSSLICMKPKYWLSLFTLASLISCSAPLTYFTESLKEKQNWNEEDIRRIQFYVSKDIVLTRSLSEGQTSIREGKIRIKDGKKYEQVVIKSGTPGVLVLMPRSDRFAISFEEDSDAYLMFGPNPKNGNRYALLAQDWSREEGNVHYKGQVYNVDARSAFASLMVDLKSESGYKYETKVVSGRKVPEGGS